METELHHSVNKRRQQWPQPTANTAFFETTNHGSNSMTPGSEPYHSKVTQNQCQQSVGQRRHMVTMATIAKHIIQTINHGNDDTAATAPGSKEAQAPTMQAR